MGDNEAPALKGNKPKKPSRLRTTLMVTVGGLWTVLVLIAVIVVTTDDPEEEETEVASAPQEVAADQDPDPEQKAASEPEPVGEPKAEPKPAETPAPPPTGTTSPSELIEQEDESCRLILARGQANLTAALLFCGAFEAGFFEGLGADGALLNLWVRESHARELLADRLQARQTATDMVKLWSTLSDVPFPTVRLYRGEVRVLEARSKARGVEVTFGQ